MSDLKVGGSPSYVNDSSPVENKQPVKKEEPGILEKAAKSAASGVAITTAAGTATAVAVASATGGALLAATPVGWGLMAGALVAGAWSIWSSN